MAELTAGEALLVIRASQEKLAGDVAKAASLITGELQKIEKTAGTINLASMLTGLNQGLQLAQQAVRGVVGTFDVLVGKSVEVGDEINRVSQSFGISAEALSGIKQAAGDVDVSFSEVQVSLKTFSSVLADAANGSDQAAAKVAALGIDLAKVKDGTLSTEDAFRLAIDSLAGMEDGYKKAALQTDLFGRAGSRFAVAFRDGSKSLDEATRAALAMGTGFDDVATKSAAKLDDQLDELRNRTSGLSLTIGKELTPAATEAVAALNEWLAANKAIIEQSVAEAVRTAADAFTAARDAVDLASVKVREFLDLIRAVTGATPDFGAAVETAFRSMGLGAIVDAKNAVHDFGVEQRAAAEAAVKAAQQLDALAKSIVASGGATEEQAALYEEGRIALAQLTDQYPAAARAVEAYRAKAAEASSVSTDLIKVLQSMKGASSATVEGITNLARASNVSVDELRKLDETGKASDDTLRKIAGAMGITVGQVRALVGALKPAPNVLKGTGDAAAKTASALADGAQKSVQFAQSQLELAAATGDMQRVQDAYVVTMNEARTAYEKSIAAADAAAKAGKSDAEVQDMRTQALKQYVSTAQSAAVPLAKIGADQIKAAQDLSKYTADLTIARDQDALSMASAKEAGDLYTKTLVDIGERLKAEREEIDRKRAAGMAAAEADRLLAEANERAAQEISKAAAATKKASEQLSKMDQIVGDLAGHLAEASLDLGLALLGGQISWQKAGKQLAADFVKEALDELKSVLLPGVKSLFTSMLSSLIPGASSAGSGVGQAAGSSILSGILGPISKAGSSIAGGLADAISPGITSEAAALGMGGGEALVTSMADSILGLLPDSAAGAVGTALGAGGVVAAVVAGVAGIGVAIAAAFGAFEGPTMVQKIARAISKMLRSSFDDPEVRQSINEGLESVGLFLGDGLEKIMTNAPRKMGAQVAEAWAQLGKDSSYQFSDGFYQDMRERGAQLIHSSIADVLNVFFPQITHDVAVGIQQSAVAAGSAMARELGLVGDKAIKFANKWAIAFIGMMQDAGKGADEILKALHRIDSSLGTSQELVASLQRLQAVLLESGEDVDALFAKINEQLRLITGKKVKVGNLDEVLAAVGGDGARALGVIENAMDLAGISVERFTGQLSDVVLAISGDAGTAIREASADMEDFGSYSDGTAQILEQKVVTALGNVVKTAEQLGYSAESVEALGTAASLISPELLKSDAVVQALHDSFAEMAVGSHMSIRELVDSIDPPLPAAVRQAILSVDDLGRAIGALSGAPLSSLKEVTDRMKQFAGQMYREVKDADGKITKELTAFGEQLVKDATSAIGGMWDTITEDGVIDPGDVQAVFEQIAQIPAEVLGDPAVQSSIQSLLAMIGEQTGDAFIIGLSALPEVTKEQLDEALAKYDEWKKDVEDNPPEVAPEVKDPVPADGSTGDTPTGPDTSAGTSAPPPAPVPPETVESWEAITEAAKAYAAAVVAGREATTALASEVVARSAEMLAAIKPIYGTVDDETSLSAITQSVRDLDTLLLGDATQAWRDWSTDAVLSISGVHTAAGELLTLVNSIPTDKTITFHLVTEGSIPTGGAVTPTPVPTSHSGELIPGAPGTETLRVLEAGELVLPADLSARLLSGATIASADVARIATAPAVAYASAGSATRAPQAPAGPSLAAGWALVPIREEALIDRAIVRLERDVADGRVSTGGGFVAHPMIHARARRG